MAPQRERRDLLGHFAGDVRDMIPRTGVFLGSKLLMLYLIEQSQPFLSERMQCRIVMKAWLNFNRWGESPIGHENRFRRFFRSRRRRDNAAYGRFVQRFSWRAVLLAHQTFPRLIIRDKDY
jgi:hypothetical protein